MTLENLENDYWGTPPEDSSYLVTRCYELRKKDLNDYSVEDYRIMIGQNVGLEHLVPRAIEILKDEPFAEGDYYEGDLLKSVLDVKREFWHDNQNLLEEVKNIFDRNIKALQESDLTDEIKVTLMMLRDELDDDSKTSRVKISLN